MLSLGSSEAACLSNIFRFRRELLLVVGLLLSSSSSMSVLLKGEVFASVLIFTLLIYFWLAYNPLCLFFAAFASPPAFPAATFAGFLSCLEPVMMRA